MLQDFKDFISKGNVVDLAVAVVIAAAFGKIVGAFVEKVLMPPIGLAMGGVDFNDLKYVLQEASAPDAATKVAEVAIGYGAFIQTIIDFLIIAFAVFIAVKMYQNMNPPAPEADPEPTPSEALLAEIRDELRRR